jgi:hypothetical protein
MKIYNLKEDLKTVYHGMAMICSVFFKRQNHKPDSITHSLNKDWESVSHDIKTAIIKFKNINKELTHETTKAKK